MPSAAAALIEPSLKPLLTCEQIATRNAALGHDAREMPSCPLVPNGVRATVTPKATGFAVELRADDAETASEILRRAKSLTTGRGAAEGHSR